MNLKYLTSSLALAILLPGCWDTGALKEAEVYSEAPPTPKKALTLSTEEGAPAPEVAFKKVFIRGSTLSEEPQVSFEPTSEECTASDEGGIPLLSFRRPSLFLQKVLRFEEQLEVCVATAEVPSWATVYHEEGGWQSAAGWSLAEGTATAVGRLTYQSTFGGTVALVASASRFCGVTGACPSVLTVQVGSPDSPPSVPVHFAGLGQTQLWFGLGAPPLVGRGGAEVQEDDSEVEDFSEGGHAPFIPGEVNSGA